MKEDKSVGLVFDNNDKISAFKARKKTNQQNITDKQNQITTNRLVRGLLERINILEDKINKLGNK